MIRDLDLNDKGTTRSVRSIAIAYCFCFLLGLTRRSVLITGKEPAVSECGEGGLARSSLVGRA